MAPELFQKQGVYSFASDLWSLGCVLFEMVAGKPPFSSNSLKELITQIMDTPTPKLEFCTKEFNELISGLLEKDPIKRSTWETVRTHPCWEEPWTELQLPPQPQFDGYLTSRGIQPAKYYEKAADLRARAVSPVGKRSEDSASATSATTGTKGEKRRDIDLLRLSQTVKKNILKDAAEYAHSEPEKGVFLGEIESCRSE